jgi:tripartite-type tricarboxylate transporter receptor subunit TctC
MRRRDLVLALGTVPLAARAVRAQQQWPTRTITMIVPFPPGGQADLAARPVAQALSTRLKQSVVVENRGGAGGAVGNAAVARAAPDGYTLLLTLSSLAVLPEADRLFERTPQYEVGQLEPIARILADPTVLAVPASMPWRSVADFVADAKARPGAISFGSSGPYGTLHIAMAMFAHAAALDLLHVPYRGAGPAVTGLLSGQIQALASAPGVLKPHVEAGTMRILGNWGAERIAAFPDVPTFRELGYREVEFYIWAGLFAPKNLAPSARTRLAAAIADAMNDAEVIRTFEAAGSPPAYLDAAAFAEFVARDSERLIKATRAIGKVG